MPLDLTGVPETLLLPLYGRAEQTRAGNAILDDPFAVDIVDKLDYDFTAVAAACNPITNVSWIARARQFDALISRFAVAHPECAVVNIGAGLDTTFHRVDNGRMRWIDLDLPEVIAMRRELIPETDRSRCIACSMFDSQWLDELPNDGKPLFLVACGCFFYFTEEELAPFFRILHERLAGAELAFDTMSPRGAQEANKMIAHAEMGRAVIRWQTADARSLEAWDTGVRVREQFPYFRGISRKGQRFRMRLFMAISDHYNMMGIAHCRI